MHCCFNLVGRHVIRITCSVMVVALDSKWTDHGVNSFKLQSVNEYSFTSCSTHRPFWRGIIYTGTNKENQTYKKLNMVTLSTISTDTKDTEMPSL